MLNSATFIHFNSATFIKDRKKITTLPLKDHPQLPFIIDTLSRREHHHLTLCQASSEKVNLALTEALTQQTALRDAQVIYLDATREVSQDFLDLIDTLNGNNKSIILATQVEAFSPKNPLCPILKNYLHNQQWRFIVFTPKNKTTLSTNLFATAYLTEPTTSELLALLKTYRPQLEEFHQVIISDEVFATAHTMAAQYLAGGSCFDKALELLDSSSARASATDRSEQSGQKKIVTSNLLSQVVSNWTHIPLTHLQNNKFQAAKFVDAVSKQIFGQDIAINLMASILQSAGIKLQEKSGPLCSFLLVGSTDVGKTELVYTMADHLFGDKSALLNVHLTKKSYRSLTEIKVSSLTNHHRHTYLLDAIKRTPYAVMLLENIDQVPMETLDLFKDIFEQGRVLDEHGNQYDFRHVIIVMTTTFSADHLGSFVETHPTHEKTNTVDLMQLVLNNHVQDTSQQQSHIQLSPQELCDELLPKLAAHFSAALLQQTHIIPMVPLDYAALEKIIRLKVKSLARLLDTNFGIELNFAPEIIKFIAHEALWRKSGTKSLEKILDQHLYACITHEILSRAEDKNRPKRLFVQLNDNGQMLRCEFVSSSDGALYNL